ncbi:hypothetical protein [Vibrio tritonius]|nr:hypothetical protein [Vibrio tritonius]
MQSPFFFPEESLRAKRYFSPKLAMNIKIEKKLGHSQLYYYESLSG